MKFKLFEKHVLINQTAHSPTFFLKKDNLNQAAYTLIEVLVVSVIIMLIAGGGIAAFTNFNQRQRVLTGAKELQSYLRTAQTLSRVGERPAACDELNGYLVRTTDLGSLKLVRILAACSGGEIETKSFTLPEGVTLEGGADLEMTFYGLHGGVAGAQVVRVTDGESLTYEFRVTQGGEITSGDFL